MILTGCEIEKQQKNGRLILDPFSKDQVNPNSYDLRLGDSLVVYTSDIVSPNAYNEFNEIQIPDDGIILEKNHFYLGCSKEILGSEHFVPIIHAKSGIARLGLFVHITADLIDIGSVGNVTFQLYPTLDVRVFKNMRIGQVSFWCVCGDIRLYKGKYQGSRGPQPSKSYQDNQAGGKTQ